ncbi:hypothetical protein ACFO1B_02180 [Dactylosporangium siamense]|uniref:Uncharacterized protein n=1 Tax=Dactylosporangium siamense TaxID=685454 RepID=A0A919UAF7_9ACTN|nr:hypothetical protein [Dactylosporangium siamense]GIG48474.1 hypothetical protein Dsi01nite_065150 [Dactylosporangium siamense]
MDAPDGLRRVALRGHGKLTPPESGDVLVTASAGAGGEAITLWAAPGAREALRKGARAPGSCAKRPVAARVVVQAAGGTTVTTIADLDLPYCHVQPLPGGRLLVVAARGGGAAIFDGDGVRLRRARVSDGIEHVLTTPSGRVWIGYFDEGVYGGDPVAHHGIVRYDADLETEWLFPFDTGFGAVDDCYALNVDGEDAWSCYYSDFPVVHLAGDAVTGWRNAGGQGANALLAAPGMCALIGGYAGSRDLATVGWLTGGRREVATETRLVLPDGGALPERPRFVGRGTDLHVFTETAWLRLGLEDLL